MYPSLPRTRCAHPVARLPGSRPPPPKPPEFTNKISQTNGVDYPARRAQPARTKKSMNRFLPPTLCAAVSLLLLCSCSRPVPDGAYRVEILEAISQRTLVSRKYGIEAASPRKFMLAETSGTNSVSIAPNSVSGERTAKAEARVTLELQEPGEQARATVTMEVKTDSATARAEETLAVPGATDLSALLTEHPPTEDLTSATTLLRLLSGEKFIQIVIR